MTGLHSYPRLARIALAAGLALGAASAHATLVDQGTTTLDTVSGLSWLDLTATTNQSFNAVSAQLGSGGAYAGYRYATMDEVLALFSHAGVTLPAITNGWLYTSAGSSADVAATAGFISLFGVTSPSGTANGNYFNYGLVESFPAATSAGFGSVQVAGNQVQWFAQSVFVPKTDASPIVGSFLVTSAVPEPDRLALTLAGGLGLAGFVAFKRRQRAG